MSRTIEYTETLVTTSCWCGIHLAVPDNLMTWAKQDEERHIFCPRGHKFVFGGSYKEQLEQERAAHNRTRDRAAADRAARSQAETDAKMAHAREVKERKAKERLAARASAGVCPHCNRTFQQLARHMKSKHAPTT